MQRLFSTFANGWPGAGLLLQRLVVSTALLHCALAPTPPSQATTFHPQTLAAAAGIFLLVGLWTPLAGTLAALSQAWVLIIGIEEPWTASVLGILGATLAMIGPGAWSVDARLFGRKHIETKEH